MGRKKRAQPASCPPKPAIEARPLIDLGQAESVERTFKLLANSTRLRLVHALVRGGEMCVGELAKAVGMKPQAVSNQLQRLVDRGIIAARRDGNHVRYRIVDPCVVSLLEQALCLIEDCQRCQL